MKEQYKYLNNASKNEKDEKQFIHKCRYCAKLPQKEIYQL